MRFDTYRSRRHRTNHIVSPAKIQKGSPERSIQYFWQRKGSARKAPSRKIGRHGNTQRCHPGRQLSTADLPLVGVTSFSAAYDTEEFTGFWYSALRSDMYPYVGRFFWFLGGRYYIILWVSSGTICVETHDTFRIICNFTYRTHDTLCIIWFYMYRTSRYF